MAACARPNAGTLGRPGRGGAVSSNARQERTAVTASPQQQPSGAGAASSAKTSGAARHETEQQQHHHSGGATSFTRVESSTARGPSGVSAARPSSNNTNNNNNSASSAAQRRGNAPNGGFVVPTAEEFVADIVEEIPPEDIPGDSVTARNVGTDGRSEQLYRSGKRVINFANGTRKVVLQSGHVMLHFSNGDVKRTYPSGKTTYWYAVAQTEQTQMPDGLQLFQFHSSQQIEKHYPDGRKEILYPEGVYKTISFDGSEVTYFPDGTSNHSTLAQ